MDCYIIASTLEGGGFQYYRRILLFIMFGFVWHSESERFVCVYHLATRNGSYICGLECMEIIQCSICPVNFY